MELISILVVLRRHLLLVLLGFVIGALIGLHFVANLSPSGISGRQFTAGEASTQMLFASTAEPASDLRKRSIAATLPGRAAVAGDLVASDASRAAVARRARIDPSDLLILGPAAGAPPYSVPLSREATAAAAAPHERHVVRVRAQAQVPILDIEASAPDPASAARLAGAVRDELEDVVASRSGSRRLVAAQGLGPIVPRIVTGGPKPLIAVPIALLFGIAWAAGIVLVSGLLSRRRGRPHVAPFKERGMPA